ncbi:MAG: hypothetical protein ACXWP4_02225 [Polyangiales bacterium]
MARKLSLLCLPFVFLVGCSSDEEAITEEDTGTPDSTAADTLVAETAIDSTIGDEGTDDADTSMAPTDVGAEADAAGETSDVAIDAIDSAIDTSDASDSTLDVIDAVDSAAEAATDSVAETDATSAPSPEIWAVRVGDGVADLDFPATNVVIERIRLSDKMLLGTLPLPTTGSDAGTAHAFTLGGAQPYEGVLTRSRDGHFVTLVGYDAPVGTADVSTSAGTTIQRVVARIDSSGTIDTSTTTTSFNKPVQSVVSVDGTQYWIGSGNGATGGIRYLTHGSSGAATTLTTIGARTLTIFGDVLYGTTTSGSLRIIEFPSPLPTTTSTPTALAGTPTSGGYDGIVFFSRSGVDTLYVCNEGNSGDGGIERWAKSSGTWSKTATFTIPPTDGDAGATIGCNALAADVVDGAVVLVAVTWDDLGRIVRIVDDGTASPAVTTIATGTLKQAYRGVSFAPRP